MNVSSVMTPDPIGIGPEASLDEASRTMDRADVRHLVVVEGGRVVGVLSDRDLLGAKHWRDDDTPEVRVREVMHSKVVTISPQDGVVMAAVEMSGRTIGCLPVLEGDKLVGILTELDLLSAYRAACRAGKLVGDTDPPISDKMHAHPTTVTVESTLDQALALCRANGMRHLPVLRDGRLVGILSDRDLRRALGERRSGDTEVEELMTPDVRTISPDMPFSEAARLMVRHKVSSLPVVDGGILEGIVTTTDLVDHCMEALRDPEA